MKSREDIKTFLQSDSFAVAGASADRAKYGNKIFRALVEANYKVYPLNPTTREIEGHMAYTAIAEIPETPNALSIVTPPMITRKVVQDAIAQGVKIIWMQPGAEDTQASQSAREAGLTVIDDGSCILVAMRS